MLNQSSEPRRLSMRLAQLLWIGLLISVFSVPAAVVGDPADDESDENAPRLAEQNKVGVEGRLAIDIAIARSEFATEIKNLDTLLRQKIRIVNQVCRLTEAQKQKLELAGRGDNKRLLDRVEKIEKQFDLAKDDLDKLGKLHQEAQRLMLGFIRPGLSTDNSLFVKSLEQMLTAEQAIKYAPLRVVFRTGGLLRLWQIGQPDESLEIGLTGTAVSDDDLADVSKLPGLKSLYLDKTQVTDAGLAHLKGLTGLTRLSLKGTRVTESGTDDLQRAIPNVTIRR